MQNDRFFNAIESEEQYEKALARIYYLMQTDIKDGSAEGEELEFLAIIVEAYEKEHYPIPSPK